MKSNSAAGPTLPSQVPPSYLIFNLQLQLRTKFSLGFVFPEGPQQCLSEAVSVGEWHFFAGRSHKSGYQRSVLLKYCFTDVFSVVSWTWCVRVSYQPWLCLTAELHPLLTRKGWISWISVLLYFNYWLKPKKQSKHSRQLIWASWLKKEEATLWWGNGADQERSGRASWQRGILVWLGGEGCNFKEANGSQTPLVSRYPVFVLLGSGGTKRLAGILLTFTCRISRSTFRFVFACVFQKCFSVVGCVRGSCSFSVWYFLLLSSPSSCLLNPLSEMERCWVFWFFFSRAVGGLALKVESSLVNLQN